MDVNRLSFIRRCRDLGFGLDQIRHLASLSTNPDQDCVEVRDNATSHLATVRQKLDELHSLQRHLEDFVQTCETFRCGGPTCDCVPLAELGGR